MTLQIFGWNGLVAMLILAGAGNASAALIVNGGFETGDFTGWTQSGTMDSIEVFVGAFPEGNPPFAGHYAAQLGPQFDLGYLSQTLATTQGNDYFIEFYWGHLPPENFVPHSEFTLSWGGNVLFDYVDSAGFPLYQHFTFTETATGSSTVLQFGFLQQYTFISLDDVSVNDLGPSAAVPEPSTLVMSSVMFGMFGVVWSYKQLTRTTAAA